MTEPLFKLVNVINPRTRMPVIDRETRRPISRQVQMTDEEAATFEAERAAQQTAEAKKS